MANEILIIVWVYGMPVRPDKNPLAVRIDPDHSVEELMDYVIEKSGLKRVGRSNQPIGYSLVLERTNQLIDLSRPLVDTEVKNYDAIMLIKEGIRAKRRDKYYNVSAEELDELEVIYAVDFAKPMITRRPPDEILEPFDRFGYDEGGEEEESKRDNDLNKLNNQQSNGK